MDDSVTSMLCINLMHALIASELTIISAVAKTSYEYFPTRKRDQKVRM